MFVLRWLKYITFSLLILTVALAIALWAVIKHPGVSAWTLHKATEFVPGLSVAKVRGTLYDGLALSEVIYQSEQVNLVSENAYLQVDWPSLWQNNQFHLVKLWLGNTAVDLPYQEEVAVEEEPFDWQNFTLPNIDLPIDIRLSDIKLHHLALYLPNSEVISLSDTLLVADVAHQQVNIVQLSTQLQEPVAAIAELSGGLQLVAPHQLDLSLIASALETDLFYVDADIILAGDLQEGIVAHIETSGDAIEVNQFLVHGDIWLSRDKLCTPHFSLVTSIAQANIYELTLPFNQPNQIEGIARIDAFDNHLYVGGQFYPQPNFTLDIDANNLAGFNAFAPIHGKLNAKGQLAGTWEQPLGEIIATGEHLGWQDMVLEHLNLALKGDMDNLTTKLSLSGLPEAGADSQVNLQLTGNLDQHQLQIDAHAMQAQVSANLAGQLSDEWIWKGALDQLTVTYPEVGVLRQAAATQLVAGAEEAKLLTPLCLTQEASQICLENTGWSATKGILANANIHDLALSRLNEFLPRQLRLRGLMNATAHYQQNGNQRQGSLRLTLPKSQAVYFTVSGRESIEYDQIELNAQLVNDDLVAHLQANLYHDINMMIAAEHRLDDLEHLNLSGNLAVPKLSFLSAFVPDINDLKGSLNADFNVQGRVEQPLLDAQVLIADVTALPVAAGVKFKIPNLSLNVNPTGVVNIDGKIISEEGETNINGWGNIADFSAWDMDVLISGQNMLVAKTPQADIWLTPNIQITANPEEVGVLGQLIIPKARLRIQDIGKSAVALSDDIVIVSKEPKEEKTSMRFVPNMRVHLEDDVILSGPGLKTGITGQLLVTLSKLGNLRLQGELDTVDGYFRAYQQDLTLEKGRIIFNGVTDNPTLNMVATRKILDDTVGVNITGSANAPKVAIFSRPVMQETDALSMLILGKKANEMTASDAAILAAKIAMEDGEDPMLKKMGDNMGVEMGLENIRGEVNSGLFIGKRLTPDLFIRYVVGAFENGARFITEYRINKLFSVEVTTGQHTSGDLYYRLETD